MEKKEFLNSLAIAIPFLINRTVPKVRNMGCETVRDQIQKEEKKFATEMIETDSGKLEELKELGERWIVLMQNVEFHVGWTAYLEVFVLLTNYYISKNDTQNVERVKKQAEHFSKHLINMYFVIGEYYSKLNRDETARIYMEHGLNLAQQPVEAHELLLTQNTKIIIPKIINWLACYYFRKGDFNRSGELVNAGIQANQSRLLLRWDVFNEAQSAKRLIHGETNAA